MRLCAFGCKPTCFPIHHFPCRKRFPERLKVWVELCGGKLETEADYQFYKKKYVCNRHFPTKYHNRNKRLNVLAVPTLFLSGTSEFDNITEAADKDKPIIQYLWRLVLDNNATNVVLTDAEIKNILTKEFHFDLPNMHELEIEIYLTVVKKYLKDWPEWDEFDKTLKKLTAKSDKEPLKKALLVGYENLKKFLKSKLDIAKALSAEWVTKARNAMKETLRDTQDPESVVLEIRATREQLNKLIYRYPHPLHETIFNADSSVPTHIKVNFLSLKEILNWWSVRIVLSLQRQQTSCVFVKRETAHVSSFSLVNKKMRRRPESPEPLDNQVKITDYKKAKPVSLKKILGSLECLKNVKENVAVEGMETIIECLKWAFNRMTVCYAPAEYKTYLSKYPYVRYLYTDVENPRKSDKLQYDIQLKEVMTPFHRFSVGRVEGKLDETLPAQWLKVECIPCAATFSSQNLATELMQHFNEYHQLEPDWECTHCHETFTMAHLAGNWWRHKC